MRLVSLNIRHGGGKRLPSLLNWVQSQRADIIIMPEWRRKSSTLIAQNLESRPPRLSYVPSNEVLGNGIAVIAEADYEVITVTPEVAAKGALACILMQELVICAAYFPQGGAKKPFFEALSSLTHNYRKSPFLITGDLNTGNNEIDLTKGATQFSCADMFDALSTKHSLVDLWRRKHGMTAQAWTWCSPKNGFRIDHAFCNLAFLSRFRHINCDYDAEPREKQLTDHSALIVDFT